MFSQLNEALDVLVALGKDTIDGVETSIWGCLSNDNTWLHLGILVKDLPEILDYISKHDGCLSKKNSFGLTPLELACELCYAITDDKLGLEEKIMFLIETFPKEVDIYVCMDRLSLAPGISKRIVNFMIEKGCIINLKHIQNCVGYNTCSEGLETLFNALPDKSVVSSFAQLCFGKPRSERKRIMHMFMDGGAGYKNIIHDSASMTVLWVDIVDYIEELKTKLNVAMKTIEEDKKTIDELQKDAKLYKETYEFVKGYKDMTED